MKRLLVFSLFAIMLLLTACPYNSDKPVDGGSFHAQTWMPGKWQRVNEDGKEPGKIYEVSVIDKEGILRLRTSGESDMKIYLSKVGKRVYLSVYASGDDLTDKGYYIYRLMVSTEKDAVELWPVNDDANVSDYPSLKDFLSAHDQDEQIFDRPKKEKYIKK